MQRYSFQRPFSEVYRLAPGCDRWRTDLAAAPAEAKVSALPARALLPRRVDYPDYVVRQPSWLVARGQVRTGIKVEKPWKDRSLTAIGPKLGGYVEKDLETIPSLELQTIANATNQPVNQPWTPGDSQVLASNAWQIVDFGCNLTGFIGEKIACRSKTRLFLTFDEIRPTAMWTSNAWVASISSVTYGVYWAAAISSHLNIGHRHLLPTYPPLCVLRRGGGSLVEPASRQSGCGEVGMAEGCRRSARGPGGRCLRSEPLPFCQLSGLFQLPGGRTGPRLSPSRGQFARFGPGSVPAAKRYRFGAPSGQFRLPIVLRNRQPGYWDCGPVIESYRCAHRARSGAGRPRRRGRLQKFCAAIPISRWRP